MFSGCLLAELTIEGFYLIAVVDLADSAENFTQATSPAGRLTIW
jgi:hypothetical protein